MPYRRRVSPRPVLLAVLAAALIAPAAAPAAKAPRTWATVNVCDTKAAPNTIGLRGSMPGMKRAGATLWMRFAVQYRADGKWIAAPGLTTTYLNIGSANVGSRGTRQAGHSFTVKPPAEGEAPFVMRGLVSFQWKTKRGTVLRTERRTTTAGHTSTAGADPAGYSAATCTIR
jgi:hypothetical protein